jgi:hypothetical protein
MFGRFGPWLRAVWSAADFQIIVLQASPILKAASLNLGRLILGDQIREQHQSKRQAFWTSTRILQLRYRSVRLVSSFGRFSTAILVLVMSVSFMGRTLADPACAMV